MCGDYALGLREPCWHFLRGSWGPEAEGDEMPGGDEDGKDAAGQSYEQGMKARGVVNFGFWNANGEEKCVERKQGE